MCQRCEELFDRDAHRARVREELALLDQAPLRLADAVADLCVSLGQSAALAAAPARGVSRIRLR